MPLILVNSTATVQKGRCSTTAPFTAMQGLSLVLRDWGRRKGRNMSQSLLLVVSLFWVSFPAPTSAAPSRSYDPRQWGDGTRSHAGGQKTNLLERAGGNMSCCCLTSNGQATKSTHSTFLIRMRQLSARNIQLLRHDSDVPSKTLGQRR